MRVLVQIAFPSPAKMLSFPYESNAMIPIPEVGEKIMGYRLGELPLTVVRRLYHYMPDQVTVRLVGEYPEQTYTSTSNDPGEPPTSS